MDYTCKNCDSDLTEGPESDRHERFNRCLECGAKNLSAVRLALPREIAIEIGGWHE